MAASFKLEMEIEGAVKGNVTYNCYIQYVLVFGKNYKKSIVAR